MKYLRILIAALVATLGVTAIGHVSTASSSATTNPNDAAYWESRTGHESVCYKHDPPTERTPHGKLNGTRTAVVLNPYQQSWPGDHWELLVVKSGSVDGGSGAGNAVFHHPQAGIEYFGPLNNGGQQGAVSHWIVCKGTGDQPEPTTVSWLATDGDCSAPTGSLAVTYDSTKVTYVGSEPGSYEAPATVTGMFTPKTGYTITNTPGPFSHAFQVEGAPCEEPVDLRLQLTAECAVGDVLHWRVTNPHDVDIAFTWNGPGSNDGEGLATAGGRTYFTTIDAGGANTTKIAWTNPSGGPSETVKAHNNQPCVYHVSFDKTWDGQAPDLDGAVLLTAQSSIGTATCTSDEGQLSCTYRLGQESVNDLHVPFGETYSVDEQVPSGWYAVSGVGEGFGSIDGFVPDALPQALAYDLADARYCTSAPEGPAKYCTHIVVNAPTTQAPEPRFVDPTCANDTTAVLDPNPDDGVTYEVEGTVAPGQTVTVRAVAGDGIVLEGTTEWTHTFGQLGETDCVVQGTPSSSIAATCGAATLTFTNTVGELAEGFTGAPIEFTYTVGGDERSVIVAPNSTEIVELTFDEDTGPHTVAIVGGDQAVVDSNCEPDVVRPAAPSFVDPTCSAPDAARVQVPSVEGVVYTVVGEPAPGTTVTVNAAAADGYVLDGPSSWPHTFPEVDDAICNPPAEPTIEVAAFSPVCQADIPYISYRIEVDGTDADRATLTFIDDTGATVRVDEDVPLVGAVIYPGAAENPNPDWPGWRLNPAGLWVPDPSDANWRDGLTVRVEVNPTAEAAVTYPAATEACYQPEQVDAAGPTTTVAPQAPTTTVASSGTIPTPAPGAQLPNTGSDATGLLVNVGLALVALGLVLAAAVRVRRPRPA